MKIHCLFFFVLALLACKTQPDAVRSITNNKQVNPPGTVWIRDSIYMDSREVSNLDYLEYVTWTKQNDPENYKAALPDTSVWQQERTHNEPYVEYYFRHPAYRLYPVVGVSYEQAAAYCKWRTARVKEFVKLSGKEDSKKYRIYKTIAYRLPAKAEWEYAASAGNAYKEYGYGNIISADHLPKIWVQETMTLYSGKYIKHTDYSLLNNDLFIPANAFQPNKFGLHNMIGNVAEMVAEKGVTKGGSVFNPLFECRISNELPYTKPTAYIGFRCVCEVGK